MGITDEILMEKYSSTLVEVPEYFSGSIGILQ